MNKHIKLLILMSISGLAGCANTAMVQSDQAESHYRKMTKQLDTNQPVMSKEQMEYIEKHGTYRNVTRCEDYRHVETCRIVREFSPPETPLVVTKEWADQWPSLREERPVDKE